MGDFCLVWGVWSIPEISKYVPVGIFQDVSSNDRGSDGGIISIANVVFEKLILVHHLSQMVEVLIFWQRFIQSLPIQTVRVSDHIWNGLSDQLFNAVNSTSFQHFAGLLSIRSDVSVFLELSKALLKYQLT